MKPEHFQTVRQAVQHIQSDYLTKSNLQSLQSEFDFKAKFEKLDQQVATQLAQMNAHLLTQTELQTTQIARQNECLNEFDLALCQKASKVSLQEYKQLQRSEHEMQTKDILRAVQANADKILEILSSFA